jgi:predicted membrane metal-binding protein
MKFELNDFYTAIRKEKDPELLGDTTCSETHHYLKAFENKSSVNWNWAAFLFAPIWMLYRRLYAPYCMLMLISIMLSYVPNAFLLIGLFINVGVGVFADSVYIYFVKQEYVRERSMNPGNIPLVVLICLHLIVVVAVSQIQFSLEPERLDQISDVFNDA